MEIHRVRHLRERRGLAVRYSSAARWVYHPVPVRVDDEIGETQGRDDVRRELDAVVAIREGRRDGVDDRRIPADRRAGRDVHDDLRPDLRSRGDDRRDPRERIGRPAVSDGDGPAGRRRRREPVRVGAGAFVLDVQGIAERQAGLGAPRRAAPLARPQAAEEIVAVAVDGEIDPAAIDERHVVDVRPRLVEVVEAVFLIEVEPHGLSRVAGHRISRRRRAVVVDPARILEEVVRLGERVLDDRGENGVRRVSDLHPERIVVQPVVSLLAEREEERRARYVRRYRDVLVYEPVAVAPDRRVLETDERRPAAAARQVENDPVVGPARIGLAALDLPSPVDPAAGEAPRLEAAVLHELSGARGRGREQREHRHDACEPFHSPPLTPAP